jgi:sulfoxide reductase heme-binding subunit YedZ
MKRIDKPILFLVCLLPFFWLLWFAYRVIFLGETTGLGANPIEYFNRYLGDWAMRFILITLAVTPVRLVSGWGGALRYRRMLGLFAFFYVFLHLTSYVALDHFFNWVEIGKDIVLRNFITVGMAAVLMLIPLAVTSTNKMVRRLGAKRWQRLHRLIYVIGPLVIVHYYMMVKADVREPLMYGGILAVLLLIRVGYALRRRLQRRNAAAAAQ